MASAYDLFEATREAVDKLMAEDREARLADLRIARSLRGKLCSDCPPAEFPQASTRCLPCPRRRP
jgi:hypothetical protein